MKIAIIGYGFVGRALEAGLKDNVKTYLVDPLLKTDISDLKKFSPEIVFICVPTPMSDDGSQDISILENVITQIKNIAKRPLIVLKSTVLPNHLSSIEKIIPEIVYNPEFLREKYANEDFINSDLIIFGGLKKYTSLLADFYDNHTKCINKNFQFTDLISASLIKYSINSYLSTKVIFFNELNKLFNKAGAQDSWENFIKILSTDKRIGSSHMEVPGPDGRFGFGGACFPKDCNAFYSYSKDIHEPFTLLSNTISINNEIRKNYDSVNLRELNQNINFDINIKK